MDKLNYDVEYPPIAVHDSQRHQSEDSSSSLVLVHREHELNVTYEKQTTHNDDTDDVSAKTEGQNSTTSYLGESSTCEETSSRSHSFAYDVSQNVTLLGQTYSDGYFNQSLERMYDRYMKNELSRTTAESDEQPTGCFDKTHDSENPKSQLERCNKKQFVIVSTTAVCMLVAATVAVVFTLNGYHSSTDHFHGTPQAVENAEVYQHAAVVTGSSICTKIGADILRKNGSAVDAAIASTFCLCVASKHTASIGGGGYMLAYNRQNQTFSAYDFSTVAPGKAKMNMFDENSTSTHNRGRYIGVPGIVKGLFTAWQKHGLLSWKELVEPALNITKYGVLVQVRSHEIAEMLKDKIEEDPGLRKLLLSPNGEPWVPGHLLIDPELMKTLEVIAEKPEDFYNGELATKIVKDASKAGGLMSLDDMANYKVRTRRAVTSFIQSFELHTIGFPTGGPVVTDLLNILKGYHFKGNDVDGKEALQTSLTYHRLIEALKFARAHRTQEGDPDFNERDILKELVSNMTDEGTAENYRQKIDDNSTKDEMYYEPVYQLPIENGGSHVSIIDANGDAVSMTTTINSWYGSIYRSLSTGIIYNDQMKTFSTTKSQSKDVLSTSPINSIHGGKRPLTAISPIIMIDKSGRVRFVVGGSGGTKIIPAVAQVVMNKLWFDDALGQAVFKPRIYDESNYNITVESGISPNTIDGLRERKHLVTMSNELEYSAVQAIYVDENGDIHAKSDARKYGHSDGY